MEKKNYIAAMDMGSGTVTIAVGYRNEEGKLVIADIVSRPMQGITRGEITNRQQVSESARELVGQVEQKLGTSLSELYTGTSGRHVRCTGHDYYVFVGERSDGEIRKEDVAALHDGMNNVQAEDGLRIMDRIPQRYVVDGRDTVKDPVGRFGKKLESTFTFVLGSSTLIERLEKTLMALGVRSRRTYANALASAEAVLLPEEREMGVAVVDLGAGTADVSVWHDGTVRFVRGIPFGSGDINSDIHQQGILEKHVEGLKTTFGTAMASQVKSDKLIAISGRSPREKQEISQKNLAIIIEHRLREIAGFVMDEIGDSGYADRLRGGIILTGGGSRLAGVDELFRDATGMEVRLALPDVNVADESLSLAQDPAHSTVIGLLLKAFSEDQPSGLPAPGSVRQPSTPTEPRRIQGRDGSDDRTQQDTAGKTSADKVSGAKGHENAAKDEDQDERQSKKGGFFRKVFGRLEDTFFSETLDGDEDF